MAWFKKYEAKGIYGLRIAIKACRKYFLEKQYLKLEILTVTSTISTKGRTVVPKELRRQFELDSGSVLDWRVEGDSMRVVKLVRSPKAGFAQALRRLGRVPAAPRDRLVVENA